MTEFATNPNAVIIQARLYANNFAGPGRWTIVEPQQRKYLLAVGPDVIPDVFSILCATVNFLTMDQLRQVTPFINDQIIGKLIDLKLLVDKSDPLPRNFVSRYHLLTIDYPPHDYFDPNWRAKDIEMMEKYANMWPSPPNNTVRQGTQWTLPPVSQHMLTVAGKSELSELEILATCLRYTFGPIGEITVPVGKFYRKTSPSGGARHPTEGVIVLPRIWGNIPAGAYVYEIEEHSLVAEPDFSLDLPELDDNSFAFVIRSRVERSMWRYRDPWAFHPVLIDVGHILETLSLLLGWFDIHTAICLPTKNRAPTLEWIEEPEMAILVASTKPDERPIPAKESTVQAKTACKDSVPLVTNPAMYMSFIQGGFQVGVLWPEHASIEIPLADFQVLNHCLPSKRGDRRTSLAEIYSSFDDISANIVEELIAVNALLPKKIGHSLYSSVELWTKYGWYEPLLAHLDAVGSRPNLPISLGFDVNRLRTVPLDNFGKTLLSRKTSRTFIQEPISINCLRAIFEEVKTSFNFNGVQPPKLFVFARMVLELIPGMYEWIEKDIRYLPEVSKKMDQHLVRSMTIGQAPASSGAATIWVVQPISYLTGAEYERDVMTIGQIGQRICLAAINQNLDIFLTPAIYESATFSALMVDDVKSNLAYVFSVGVHRE
jgi:hypothetical protein